MLTWLQDLYTTFFGAQVTVAPEYLVVTIVIAWIVWRLSPARRAPGAGFWHWLTPREVWGHRSVRLDFELFALSRLLVFVGFFGKVSLTTAAALAIAAIVTRITGAPASATSPLSPLALTFLLWLVNDFAIYWVHRAHHQIALIWPLHAVHHSAEVLTPFTAYRQHPVDSVIMTVIGSALIGLAQGLVIGTLAPAAHVATIAGANSFAVISRLALANFHHSHIWISYGPVLERLFISPAQHQIHHSIAPEHHNRNYGMTLAIWDWIFGTLYVIRRKEDITFGLTDPAEAKLMTHRLLPALINPLSRLLRTSRR